MDKKEMDYKYASSHKIYYLSDDSSLSKGAYYLAETLSSSELKVFYDYARDHSSGAPFRGSDGYRYLLKYKGGDFILSE